MARLPRITVREDLPAKDARAFNSIAESRGSVSGPFSMLLHSPEVAARTAHLGTYIRFESVLSPADRELAIITTSREFDCGFEWSAHEPLAREAGVPPETIETVAHRGDVGRLSPRERTIVEYGRQLFRNLRVSDETFDEARSLFGDRGVVELTATLGYYAMLACTLNAFRVEPGHGSPTLP